MLLSLNNLAGIIAILSGFFIIGLTLYEFFREKSDFEKTYYKVYTKTYVALIILGALFIAIPYYLLKK